MYQIIIHRLSVFFFLFAWISSVSAYCEGERHFTHEGEEIVGERLKKFYSVMESSLLETDSRSLAYWKLTGANIREPKYSPFIICTFDVLATKIDRGEFTTDANLFLSALYSFANRSVSADPARSTMYAKNAAERGDPFANVLVALAYLNGFGVKKDDELALAWFARGVKVTPVACEILADLVVAGKFSFKWKDASRRQKVVIELYRSSLTGGRITRGILYEHFLTENLGRFPDGISRQRVLNKLAKVPGGAEVVASIEAASQRAAELRQQNEVEESQGQSESAAWEDFQKREALRKCEERVSQRYSRGQMNLELCQ